MAGRERENIEGRERRTFEKGEEIKKNYIERRRWNKRRERDVPLSRRKRIKRSRAGGELILSHYWGMGGSAITGRVFVERKSLKGGEKKPGRTSSPKNRKKE